MQQERMMMGFVLSFIALIAAFCIMAVMFTVSIQRKKELALLKALGATPFQVVRVFLWQGVLIGIIGSVLGVALALLVLHYRMYIHAFLRSIGHDPFPMDFHGVEIPAEINPYDLIEQSVKAFVMVVVASVIPALFTAYQDPAKALRSM
jgi:lipoprotein-releasing system permease protein